MEDNMMNIQDVEWILVVVAIFAAQKLQWR
jgi:hypothetical protein